MAGENRENLDGMMKDSYSSKKGGFKKSMMKQCKMCGKAMRHSGGTMCAGCSRSQEKKNG